jgi:hypothetical protein
MPEWKTVKNMTKFANEVMPRLRAKGTAEAVEELAGVGAGGAR